LFTSDYLNKCWINISSEQLDSIKKTIEKYISWVSIATENKVEINKSIPDSEIDTSIAWKYGDNWYENSYFRLYFEALSQTIERHQLVISSNKVRTDENQFITIKLDPLYLDYDQAQSLLNGINQETINQIVKEHEKQKKNQELFN